MLVNFLSHDVLSETFLKKKTKKINNTDSQATSYFDDSLNEFEEAQLREAILASKREYESKNSLQEEEIIVGTSNMLIFLILLTIRIRELRKKKKKRKRKK